MMLGVQQRELTHLMHSVFHHSGLPAVSETLRRGAIPQEAFVWKGKGSRLSTPPSCLLALLLRLFCAETRGWFCHH